MNNSGSDKASLDGIQTHDNLFFFPFFLNIFFKKKVRMLVYSYWKDMVNEYVVITVTMDISGDYKQ